MGPDPGKNGCSARSISWGRLAISLVMVLSIVFYVKMASIYPEMDRDRLLTVKSRCAEE